MHFPSHFPTLSIKFREREREGCWPEHKAKRWVFGWGAIGGHSQGDPWKQPWRGGGREANRRERPHNTTQKPCPDQMPQRDSWVEAVKSPALISDVKSMMRSLSLFLWRPESMLLPPVSSISLTPPPCLSLPLQCLSHREGERWLQRERERPKPLEINYCVRTQDSVVTVGRKYKRYNSRGRSKIQLKIEHLIIRLFSYFIRQIWIIFGMKNLFIMSWELGSWIWVCVTKNPTQKLGLAKILLLCRKSR